MIIRDLVDGDAEAWLDLFLVSMNWRGTEGWTAATAREDPHVRRYIDGWGTRAGDAGVVAVEHDGRILGSAWMRIFAAAEPGYGFVAQDVPEIGLAVHASARGHGVGSALLSAVVAQARERGRRGLSLSVEDGNVAARALYDAAGFVRVGRVGDSDTLLLTH